MPYGVHHRNPAIWPEELVVTGGRKSLPLWWPGQARLRSCSGLGHGRAQEGRDMAVASATRARGLAISARCARSKISSSFLCYWGSLRFYWACARSFPRNPQEHRDARHCPPRRASPVRRCRLMQPAGLRPRHGRTVVPPWKQRVRRIAPCRTPKWRPPIGLRWNISAAARHSGFQSWTIANVSGLWHCDGKVRSERSVWKSYRRPQPCGGFRVPRLSGSKLEAEKVKVDVGKVAAPVTSLHRRYVLSGCSTSLQAAKRSAIALQSARASSAFLQ
jgi:hypothetical protein